MASEEDLRLVARVLEQQAGALETLIEEYRPFVYAILTRHLNLSPADADEVFQRLLVHLWEDEYRRLRRWSGKGSLASYIGRIVRNLGHDYRREHARQSLAELADVPVDDARFIQAERKELLAEALSRLSGRDRELIRRRYAMEESYRQIAEALGITVSNVGVSLHRAEKRLRELLSSEL